MNETTDEALWIYTQNGAFPFWSRSRWEDFFNKLVRSGWEKPSAGEIGWLQSSLVRYPPWSFFTAADAASLAATLEERLTENTAIADRPPHDTAKRLVDLFRDGPVLILSEPPRKTVSTNLREIVYIYSCAQCGFMHHGSWLFDMNELSLDDVSSSVESLLKYKYCPICGSKDIVSIPFFLPSWGPDGAPDFMW